MNEKEVLTWIAELFEEPLDNIRPDTSRDDIDAWDSLGVLNLMGGSRRKF